MSTVIQSTHSKINLSIRQNNQTGITMNLELETQLARIADLVAKQQDVSFSSQKQAQRYLDNLKEDIRHLFQQSNEALVKGLTYLSENNQGYAQNYVAGIAMKLLRRLGAGKTINQIIESEIWSNENALLFFAEAVDACIDRNDLEREQCAITVLMALFPLNPQPYIYLGSSIWRNEGIAAAASFYDKVANVLQSPPLSYFAAECFYQNGDKDKARQALQSALEQTPLSPELASEITQLLAQINNK